MKRIALILILLMPSWAWAETFTEALESLNGRVVDFVGLISEKDGYNSHRYMTLYESKARYDFEYTLPPSKLREVLKVCDPFDDYYTCALRGKAELTVIEDEIKLYVFEVTEVTDTTKN